MLAAQFRYGQACFTFLQYRHNLAFCKSAFLQGSLHIGGGSEILPANVYSVGELTPAAVTLYSNGHFRFQRVACWLSVAGLNITGRSAASTQGRVQLSQCQNVFFDNCIITQGGHSSRAALVAVTGSTATIGANMSVTGLWAGSVYYADASSRILIR